MTFRVNRTDQKIVEAARATKRIARLSKKVVRATLPRPDVPLVQFPISRLEIAAVTPAGGTSPLVVEEQIGPFILPSQRRRWVQSSLQLTKRALGIPNQSDLVETLLTYSLAFGPPLLFISGGTNLTTFLFGTVAYGLKFLLSKQPAKPLTQAERFTSALAQEGILIFTASMIKTILCTQVPAFFEGYISIGSIMNGVFNSSDFSTNLLVLLPWVPFAVIAHSLLRSFVDYDYLRQKINGEDRADRSDAAMYREVPPRFQEDDPTIEDKLVRIGKGLLNSTFLLPVLLYLTMRLKLEDKKNERAEKTRATERQAEQKPPVPKIAQKKSTTQPAIVEQPTPSASVATSAEVKAQEVETRPEQPAKPRRRNDRTERNAATSQLRDLLEQTGEPEFLEAKPATNKAKAKATMGNNS